MTYVATDKNDATSKATVRFDIEVQSPPIILSPYPDLVENAGQSVSATLPAAIGGSGSYSYAARGLPSWLALNGRTLTGKAPSSNKAAVTVTYTATDIRTSMTAEITFTVTVAVRAVHMPPVRSLAANGGSRVTISLPSAGGGSGNGFTYALSGRPSWLRVNGFVASGTAGYQRSSYTANMTWRATDKGSGQTVTSTFSLKVNVQPLNLSAQDDLTVFTGLAVSRILPFASGGSGRYSYAISGLPSWMARSRNTISGTAPNTPQAAVTVTWQVGDSVTGAVASIRFRISVIDPTPDVLPQVSHITKNPGVTFAINLPVATGGAGGGFTYRLDGIPDWITLEGVTISGTTPYRGTSYETLLTWVAIDKLSLREVSVHFSFTVNVRPLSFTSEEGVIAPDETFEVYGSQVIENKPVSGGFGGSFAFNYSISGLPLWLTFTPNTASSVHEVDVAGGVLNGTAPATAQEDVVVTVTATDVETRLTVQMQFTVKVKDAPPSLVINRPDFGDTFAMGTSVTTAASVAGQGDAVLMFTLLGAPDWLIIISEEDFGYAQGTPPIVAEPYELMLTWRVVNPLTGGVGEDSFTISIVLPS